MAWKVYGAVFEPSHFTNVPEVSQSFICDNNEIVLAIRTWFVFFDATMTDIELRIYSDKNGFPMSLLHTSINSFALADVTTEDYALKELYFTFNPTFSIRGGDKYHVVPYIDGYSASSTSHIAWVRGYPDPNNDIDLTVSFDNIGRMPFLVSFIGDRK